MAKSFANKLATENGFDMMELIDGLRKELRKELKLQDISPIKI